MARLPSKIFRAMAIIDSLFDDITNTNAFQDVVRDKIVSIHSLHHFKPYSCQWQVDGGLLCIQSVVKGICGHISNLSFVNCGKYRQIPICLRTKIPCSNRMPLCTEKQAHTVVYVLTWNTCICLSVYCPKRLAFLSFPGQFWGYFRPYYCLQSVALQPCVWYIYKLLCSKVFLR